LDPRKVGIALEARLEDEVAGHCRPLRRPDEDVGAKPAVFAAIHAEVALTPTAWAHGLVLDIDIPIFRARVEESGGLLPNADAER
jgi:hypothetical protein